MAHIRIKSVEALISDGMGDAEVLKPILRAMKRGEVISEAEHDYVQKLVDAHLVQGTRPAAARAAKPPAADAHKETSSTGAPARKHVRDAPAPGTLKTQRRPKWIPRISKKKIAVFVIIVILVVGSAYVATRTPAPSAPPAPQEYSLPAGVMLGTDQAAYSSGDIIQISGRTAPGAQVQLDMAGAGTPLWQDSVSANSSGVYSTIVIAGGTGWVGGTTYSITATAGTQTQTTEFLFQR